MLNRTLRANIARFVVWLATVTSGLLLGVSCSLGQGQDRPISPSPADADKIVGHLAWVITDTGTNAVVAQGTTDVRVRDIRVTDKSSSDGPNYSKTIRLNDEFSLSMAEFPERTKDELQGFGMTADREGGGSFCWEWFDIDSDEHATKLQESGVLRIRSAKGGQGWEIVYTEFLSDVSFRVSGLGVDDLVKGPKWRVNVAKGSVIQWPSVANGKLVLN
jgi:hypothetical protein